MPMLISVVKGCRLQFRKRVVQQPTGYLTLIGRPSDSPFVLICNQELIRYQSSSKTYVTSVLLLMLMLLPT